MHAGWLSVALMLLSPAALSAGDGKKDDESLHVFPGFLDAKDPLDRLRKQSHSRIHKVELKAGKHYIIDLISRDFDTYLRLEDKDNKTLDENDDVSDKNLNSQLRFTPTKTGTYRLVVTTYAPSKTGAYVLLVRPKEAAKGGMPAVEEAVRLVQLADDLNAAGLTHRQAGDYKAAEHVWRAALAIRKTLLPADHLDLAASLNNYGGVLHVLGQPEEGCRHLELALGIYRTKLPADDPRLASALGNLARVLVGLGRFEQARQHVEESVSLRKRAASSDPLGLAASLHNLGHVYCESGKFAEARPYLEEALGLLRKLLPANHPDVAQSVETLALVFRALGRREEARSHFEQALWSLRKDPAADPRDVARCLSNLGTLLHELGRSDPARRYLAEALTICKKALPPDHVDLAKALHNLGWVLQGAGQREEGLRHYEESLAVMRKAVPADHPSLAVNLDDLGLLLRHMGRMNAARACLEEALAIRRKSLPGDHPHLAESLTHLGELLWSLGHRHEGWALLSGAVAASARYLRRTATASAQRDVLALLAQSRPGLDPLLGVTAAHSLSDSQGVELLLRLLEAKGISTAALTSRRDALLRDADPRARAIADQVLPLQRQLADLLLQGPGKRDPLRYREECLALEKQIDDLERQLGLRLQSIALLQQVHTATPADLLPHLPQGAVLIETVRFDPAQYAALLLWPGTSGPQVRFVPLGPAPPLEKAILAWRGSVQKGTTDPGAQRTLRELLWAPLAKVLPPTTTRLIIAPDGVLALLPFEALQLDDGKYLIESMRVSYVSTGRDLMPLPLPKERGQAALVLSDPDYSLSGPAARPATGKDPADAEKLHDGLAFRPLPGFAREADAVAKLLAGLSEWRVEQRRGGDASEERLAEVKRPRLLHVVTHGFFLEDVKREPSRPVFRDLEVVGTSRPQMPNFGQDRRLRSGLALAGANRWQERSAKGLSDGLLTALEVENLDLWGTELVVLSACDTGRGEIRNGEGVLGLRRAFQLAGAQTVLASLWKVPDAETERLMSDTLSRWLKGAPPQEALRAAQLEMIRHLRQSGARNGKQGEAPPLYWAGFVCHGR